MLPGLLAKIEKYKLDHDPIMPEFDLPEGYTDKDEYLRFLTYKGAKERWGTLNCMNRPKDLILSWI